MSPAVRAGNRPRRRALPRQDNARGLVKTVTAGFLVLAAANAVGFYGLPVYLGGLVASGRFSLELLSGLTSVFFIVSGVASLLAGRSLAVVSVRTVLLLGAALTGVGVWLVGHAAVPWQLLCAYVLLGIGMSLTGPIPLTTALIQAAGTSGRRDQAMAVMLGGMTAGGAIFIPVLANMVEGQGLPAVTAWAAPVAALAIAVPALLVARAGATDRLPAAGGDVHHGEARGAIRGRSPRASWGTFLLLGMTFACFLGSQVGFNTQLYAIASERGIAGAGSALGIVAAMGMAARIAGIVLVKWLPAERFLGSMAAAQALSSLVLLLFTDRTGLYVAACLLGMAVGNASVLSPVLTLKFFGREAYSKLVSRLSFVMTLGIASGPVLAGKFRAVTGSYDSVLIGITAVSLLAGGGCLILDRMARSPAPRQPA